MANLNQDGVKHLVNKIHTVIEEVKNDIEEVKNNSGGSSNSGSTTINSVKIENGDSANTIKVVVNSTKSKDFTVPYANTAGTADALTVVSKGSATLPVYFDANGIPVACTHTLETSVPSNAVFTDEKTSSSNQKNTKLFLVGVNSQSSSGQSTYSNDGCYVGNDNCLYSDGKKVSTDNNYLPLTGGTLNGQLAISIGDNQSDSMIFTERTNLNKKIGFGIDKYGVKGIYDYNNKKWILKVDDNASSVEFNGSAKEVYINNSIANLELPILLTTDYIDSKYPDNTAPGKRSVYMDNTNSFSYNPSTKTVKIEGIMKANSIESTNSITANSINANSIEVDDSITANSITSNSIESTNSITSNSINANSIEVDDSITANKMTSTIGFFETSDERLKDIVNPIVVDLDKLSKLRKVYFNWKDRLNSDLQIGMIAQDVQELYPELVSEINGQLNLSYEKLSVIALKAIDVLHNENNELKSRIERLETLVNQLSEKIID